MNCDEVKNLGLTDYLDGELDRSQTEAVGEHLKSCSRCREATEAIRESVSSPFKLSENLKPPERVWSNIKERILADEEELTQKPAIAFGQVFGGLFTFKRLAIALPLIAILFVIVALPHRIHQPYGETRTFVLESMGMPISGEPEDAEFSNGGFDSVVEAYFM